MKTIIAGSRDITSALVIAKAADSCGFLDEITEVVSGTARGVDQIGEAWADFMRIPVKRFPADWNALGKRAGYVRNEQMADYADALIAVWNGESKGTKHMIDIATRKGLKVYVHRV